MQKNFYTEIEKHNIETKGLDYAKMVKYLQAETMDKFARAADTMEIPASRCFVQACYNVCNQMLSVGAAETIDHQTILAEAAQLAKAV